MLKSHETFPASIPKFTDGEPWHPFEELLQAELARRNVSYLLTARSDDYKPVLDPVIASIQRRIARQSRTAFLTHDQSKSIDYFLKREKEFNANLTSAYYIIKDSLSDFVWQGLLTSNYDDTLPEFSTTKLKNLVKALRTKYGSATATRVDSNLAKINRLPAFETHIKAEQAIVSCNRLHQERKAWGITYETSDSERLLWITRRLNTSAFKSVLEDIERRVPPIGHVEAMAAVLRHINALKDRALSNPPSTNQDLPGLSQVLAYEAQSSRRTCHICNSPEHLMKDCPYHNRSLQSIQSPPKQPRTDYATPSRATYYPPQLRTQYPPRGGGRDQPRGGRDFRGGSPGRGRGRQFTPTALQLQNRDRFNRQHIAKMSQFFEEEEKASSADQWDDYEPGPQASVAQEEEEPPVQADFAAAFLAQYQDQLEDSA
jgi:hypothetical protein